MHWSESNLPVSMQGKSKALRNIYIEAANKSFSKFEDEQAALFAASQAVSSEERKLANEKRKSAPAVPLHLKAVLDAAKTAFEPASKRETIQQAFLPKNALQSGLNRSLVSADFDDKGQLVLLFDTGEKIVTSEIAIKEYIEQNIAIAPNTQIISTDDSITINQTNQTFDLGTAAVINPLDHLDFNQSTTSTGAVARLKWNDTDGTLEFGLKGGNVTLQVGQEEVVHILNNTANPFTDLQVIRVTGASGQRITGALAQASGESTSAATFAVVTEPIAKNAVGFATVSGLVRDVDTSSFPEGSALYLSPTIAGAITHIKPQAPNHMVLVGWCVRSNQNNGIIYVHIQNGYELDELHNVKLNGLSNGDVLTWNSTTSLWENKPTAAPPDVSKTITYFSKISTTAGIAYTVEHNMGLVDKDAFTINTMLAGSQVQTAVSSVNTNSLTITTSVATIDLAITIIGIKP